MSFFVGQKVVCFNNTLGNGVKLKRGEIVPVVNVVYTIREIFDWMGTTQLRLKEIVNPPCRDFGNGAEEASYNASRFRPVVEKKTDISLFVAMLAPKKVTERQPA